MTLYGLASHTPNVFRIGRGSRLADRYSPHRYMRKEQQHEHRTAAGHPRPGRGAPDDVPRHKFVLVGERSIQVTRQDDTARVPGWLLISSDPEKIRADLRQDGRP